METAKEDVQSNPNREFTGGKGDEKEMDRKGRKDGTG